MHVGDVPVAPCARRRPQYTADMPTIRLYRPAPLTPDEVLALPPGAAVTDPATDERARLTLDLPELLQAVYELGSTLPACRLTLDAELAPVAPAAPAEPDLGTDPWKLVDAGDPRAEKLFVGNPLDSAGRGRVQTMLASPDPAVIALACRIACWTDWRSGVQLIRRLVAHPSPVVRKEVVTAIGQLAGPSLTMTIRPLRTDPDPEVRAAAIGVLKRFGD